MEYKYLGNTGIQVSQLCFGTMSFGGDADEETSTALFGRCRDAGINFFDTANVYSRGRSEEILGKLIRGSRDELVITSKVLGAMSDDVNARGLSRRHIRAPLRTVCDDWPQIASTCISCMASTRKCPLKMCCTRSMTWCNRAKSCTRQ
jgi:aryl-alcohol dehydrogenase-like predicted oxidoreductase